MEKKINRSSDIVENQLIKLILKGEYSSSKTLPPERELAVSLGIGRPTLREAIQRLERDGWISVRKGQQTLVNDYWKKGNLNTLVNIVENIDEIPDDFIIHLLELRSVLTPSFVKDAVNKYPAKVVSLLSNIDALEDSPDHYAIFDWQLQKNLAELSDNPIYLLILNSFDEIYVKLANRYFSINENRSFSLNFYHDLLASAMKGDSDLAENVTGKAMKKSIELWKKRMGVI